MATGTVSSIAGDNWQTITTVTPTTGTTATFSSIAGYKTLMLAWSGVNLGTNGNLSITFNGSSTGYASLTQVNGQNDYSYTKIELENPTYGAGTTNHTGYINITNPLATAPKITNSLAGSTGGGTVVLGNAMWNNTAAITSIVVTSTTAFSGTNTGTFTLYGIAS